jgi:hypothetical protein
MFHDVDETLRVLLTAEMPVERGEIDISFDRPTREWSARLARPTLNLFLYDLRERKELKDDVPIVTRSPNGGAVKRMPPKRMDLAYMITAWTKEPDDEHRILGRVLSCMYRQTEIEAKYIQGDLKASEYPILARVTDPDALFKPDDLWGVIENDLRASLSWVITAPLDAFRPETGPLVRERDIRLDQKEG